jgi:ABC-type uncharacterized transport system ATPase subunit
MLRVSHKKEISALITETILIYFPDDAKIGNMNNTRNKTVSGDVVVAQELTKKFGDEFAVNSLTMRVPQGTIFGFIGPSGCGKTTTVRLLTGIHKPTSGEVTVLGKEPIKFTKSDQEKI